MPRGINLEMHLLIMQMPVMGSLFAHHLKIRCVPLNPGPDKS